MCTTAHRWDSTRISVPGRVGAKRGKAHGRRTAGVNADDPPANLADSWFGSQGRTVLSHSFLFAKKPKLIS
jgi:hypothetical protein